MAMSAEQRWQKVQALRREAPRDWVMCGLVFAALSGCFLSWIFLDLELVHPVTGASRFVFRAGMLEEFVPHPMRQEGAGWSALPGWISSNLEQVGWQAVSDTLALSVLAMVLAALIALPLVLPAARNITLERGFLPADRRQSWFEELLRRLTFLATRMVLVILRAIPEYLWAFLLLILMGPVPLAGVLALALHNAGILAKLTSETVEDMDKRPVEALAGLGGRTQEVAVFGVAPRAFRQFLVYFFYRWETCIRETAILGILAIHTLGLHIEESFDFFHYDKALLFILINSILVIAGDLAGSWGRRAVRHG